MVQNKWKEELLNLTPPSPLSDLGFFFFFNFMHLD